MLNKGDKCFVRIHTGEIVVAEYVKPINKHLKNHHVNFNGINAVATSHKPFYSKIIFVVRFVNMNHLKIGKQHL